MNPTVEQVTRRISQRSRDSRQAYLRKIEAAAARGPRRVGLSCSNLAHGMAACGREGKDLLGGSQVPNVAIVSAYNDMLSAHQPMERFPDLIRQAAREAGAIAQFAGGVPAMCDGVTQGQAGMELSLFSRDLIAMATAVALSHDMFDASLCLGVCDKIVPGLLIGALAFGHLPFAFVPAGPMVSGLSNKEKARVREDYAAGKVGREALLAAESAAYHGPGTCTFYGTANSNQMLMEIMGLQLPGGSFVNPGTALRDALTGEAVRQVLARTHLGPDYLPVGRLVDERSIVNGIVGLLATGGSTNHTMHLVAIAAAAGIRVDWDDFAKLSSAVPLLARVYPNGAADVNHFHAAGGMGFVIAQLLDGGLLHEDVHTLLGRGLSRFLVEPFLENGRLAWRAARRDSLDSDVLRPVTDPFDREGGIRLVRGDIGRAVVKVSAVEPARRRVQAPARVFATQESFEQAFKAGDLDGQDMVAVIPFQGPQANGMPELHKLTPYLSVLQARGQQVALLTDGRMSGASGRVLAAIQVTPEAAAGGAIARIRDGDLVTVDAEAGLLDSGVAPPALAARRVEPPVASGEGTGRELFALFRHGVGTAEAGASIFSGGET